VLTGWGVVKGPFHKNNFLIPKNDKFGRILTQFLTDRKHGTVTTRILRFNRETKLTKIVQNYPKIYGQNKGAVAPSPPEYATAFP